MMRALKTGLAALLVAFIFTTAAYAASYDGVYNYSYNLYGPNGWETHTVPSGFIVKNGVISSNPSAFGGTVSSNGAVSFVGPSPYGSPTATFTGVIYSDGTGKGTYIDSQGLEGAWSVARVSGGSGFTGSAFDVFMSITTAVGEVFGFTGVDAEIYGTVISALAISTVVTLALTSGRRKAGKTVTRGQYVASMPDTAESLQGAPPSTIGVPPPPPNPPVGVSVGLPGLPLSLNLKAKWGRKVNLNWDKPKYSKNIFDLYGFEVMQLRYDGSGTQPRYVMVERLNPNTNKWNAGFKQTYQFSTTGDISGYRVDALFLDKRTPFTQFVRVGDTAFYPRR